MSFTTPSGSVIVPHSNLPFRNHRLPADHEATGLRNSLSSVANSNPNNSRLQPVAEESARYILSSDNATVDRDSLGSIGTVNSVHTSSSVMNQTTTSSMNQTAKNQLEIDSARYASRKNQIKVTPPVARILTTIDQGARKKGNIYDSDGDGDADGDADGDNSGNRSSLGGDNRSSLGGDNRSSLGGDNRSSLGGDNRSSLGGNDSNVPPVILSGLYSFHLKNPETADSSLVVPASPAASPSNMTDKPRVVRKSSKRHHTGLNTDRSNESSSGLPNEIRDGSRVLHRKNSSRSGGRQVALSRAVSDDNSQKSIASTSTFMTNALAADLARLTPPAPADSPTIAEMKVTTTTAIPTGNATTNATTTVDNNKAQSNDSHTFGLSAIANMWPRKTSVASVGSAGVQSIQTRSIQDADEDEIDEYYDSSSSDYEGSDDSDSDEYDEFSDPGDSEYSVASHNSPRGSFSTATRGVNMHSLNPGQAIHYNTTTANGIATGNSQNNTGRSDASVSVDKVVLPSSTTRTRRLTDFFFGTNRNSTQRKSTVTATTAPTTTTATGATANAPATIPTATVTGNNRSRNSVKEPRSRLSALFKTNPNPSPSPNPSPNPDNGSSPQTQVNQTGLLSSPRLSAFFGFRSSTASTTTAPATANTTANRTQATNPTIATMRNYSDSRSSYNPSPNPTSLSNGIHPDPSMNSMNSSSNGQLDRIPGESNLNINSCLRPWTRRLDGGINSQQDGARGEEIYFVGVIDILQQYNMNKRMETFLKSFVHDSNQISSVNSQFYAKRFVKFVSDHSD